MKRIAVVGVMLIFAAMQHACFESVTEAPLEIHGDALRAPQKLSAGVGDGRVTLEWRPAEGARRYRIYRSVDTMDGMERIAEMADTTYIDTNVRNGRVYFYAVSSISAQGLEGDRSDVIDASPAIFAVVINDGAAATRSLSVSLALRAPETTASMLISNDAAGTGADWEGYEATRSWTLSGADGAKSVYARFMDRSGALSSIVSSSIVLDRFAMIESIEIGPVPRLYSPGATAHFRMRVEGSERSGIAKIAFENFSGSVDRYDNGLGGDGTADDGVYEADFAFPGWIRGSNVAVVGSFVDAVGNVAQPFECPDRISFFDPPSAVHLIGVSDSSQTSITIAWTVSSDMHFRSYRIYRSAYPGVTESALQFVQELSDAAQMSYQDSGLKEGALYYYRIFVVNDLNETAGSNEILAHTYDAVPDPVVLDDPSSVGEDRLTLTWSMSGASDFDEYRLYRATQPGVTTASLLIATITDCRHTYYDEEGLNFVANNYYYRIFVFDESGKSARSNEVTTAP